MRQLLFVLGELFISIWALNCPEGNDPNTQDHCIHMETTPMTWNDAEAFCVARGGHLTSVHNQYDNNAVRGERPVTDDLSFAISEVKLKPLEILQPANTTGQEACAPMANAHGLTDQLLTLLFGIKDNLIRNPAPPYILEQVNP
ncbi:hypothetical protein ANCDUO_04250 [Ancylostoma duodenale]|uniref:C-type lectin domain-containing protein n=1 Tax=Ancylostoma duodenale TaxID=51022 RepID=A0A0C2D736_9BILA|nr:hypothetical protein ANCDUO_04250 [Ancylostoma duodenale]